jgi:hypothetical protein
MVEAKQKRKLKAKTKSRRLNFSYEHQAVNVEVVSALRGCYVKLKAML